MSFKNLSYNFNHLLMLFIVYNLPIVSLEKPNRLVEATEMLSEQRVSPRQTLYRFTEIISLKGT